MFGPSFGSGRAAVLAPILPAPYGAAELRALAPRHTLQGLAVAALAAVGLFAALAAFRTDEAPVVRARPIWVTPPTFAPPPSVRPSAPASAPAKRVPKAATGTPTPVPDAQQPQSPTFSPASPAPSGAEEGTEGAGETGSGTPGMEAVPPILPTATPPPAPVPVEPPPLPAPEVREIAAVMPRVLEAPVPVYPPLARQAGVEGRVILRVRVGRDGSARSVTIVRSDNALLDEAARDAVARWRFQPGTQDGQAVDVWMTIPVRFRLRERS